MQLVRVSERADPLAEGVCTAAKSPVGKHSELEVPNLYVVKAMQSLHSRGYVQYKFSWQYFYYSLTNEVCAVLRSRTSAL